MSAFDDTTFVAICYSCTAFAIVVYDILLTISREVDCVWKRRFSGVTLLYALNRYGTLVRTFLEVFGSLYSSASPKIMIPWYYVLEILGYLTETIFTSLRVWAVCDRRWVIFAVTALTGISPPIAIICWYSFPKPAVLIPSSGPNGGLCGILFVRQHSPIILLRGCIIISNVLVLVLTWWKTGGVWRLGREKRLRFEVVTLILRDGTSYFVAILLLNAITLVLDVLGEPTSFHSGSHFIFVCNAVSNVLISRFILDLRVFYSAGCVNASGALSSLHFARSGQCGVAVAADFGAHIDPETSTWTTGAADFPEESDTAVGTEEINSEDPTGSSTFELIELEDRVRANRQTGLV